VLLVGQPTRGVDIGAIEFIHGRLRAMRDAGCAVLLVSQRARRDPGAGRPRGGHERRAASPASWPLPTMHRERALGRWSTEPALRKDAVSEPASELPRWVDLVLLPAVSTWRVALLAAAAVVAAGRARARCEVIAGAGARAPSAARAASSYTLYYATTFIFTGLAVAVAFHGGLFNIGGEGQAIMGGLGAGLVALWLLDQPAGLGHAAA